MTLGIQRVYILRHDFLSLGFQVMGAGGGIDFDSGWSHDVVVWCVAWCVAWCDRGLV